MIGQDQEQDEDPSPRGRLAHGVHLVVALALDAIDRVCSARTRMFEMSLKGNYGKAVCHSRAGIDWPVWQPHHSKMARAIVDCRRFHASSFVVVRVADSTHPLGRGRQEGLLPGLLAHANEYVTV